VEPLHGVIRRYDWGSRTAIATIQGRPVPAEVPEAELWLGAHPDSPATVRRDGAAVSLDELIRADPGTVLGPAVLDRFGPRLPYLLKLLAADRPLSLQAHPDAARARAAYARQGPGGGGYTDPYHKPELLVAVTDFDALCGFRHPADGADLLARLGLPELDPVLARLRGADPAAALAGAVAQLLTWPAADRAALVAAAVAAAKDGAGTDPVARDALALVAELGARFPADPAVLVTVLLNRVRLAPDEAIWLPAGNLHGYLRGTGMEILASSDNVLRGGLTAKPVDTAELLAVLRFEVLTDPVRAAVPVAPGVLTWPVPVPDFALFQARVAGTAARVPAPGPVIAFCLAGAVVVDDARVPVPLRAGQAAFGPAGVAEVTVRGTGTVFLATAGVPALR